MNPVITESWPSVDSPPNHTVTTEYQTGQTVEQWQARHDAKVAYDKAHGFPVVIPN